MSDRPAPLSVRLDAIPPLLRQLPHWILWRYVRLIDAGGQVRWTMAPVRAITGGLARLGVASTWTDFATATDALPDSGCDGLGFVLTRPRRTPPEQPGLVVLELHDCRDPRTGRLDAWAPT